MRKITCVLDDTTGLVEIKYDNGLKKCNRLVTATDFIKSIQTSIAAKESNDKVIKYITPLYTEKENVRLLQVIEYESGKKVYFVHFMPTKMPVMLYERFFDDVGLPGTIFAIGSVNGVWANGNIVCVKDTKITMDTQLYYYPFSNGNDNHICIGKNKFSFHIDEYSVLDIPKLFFTMPNTKCSFHPNFNSNKYDYDEMLRELSGKDFDNSFLVPMTNINYKRFIEEEF